MKQNDFVPEKAEGRYINTTADFEKKFFKASWADDDRTDFFICCDGDAVICAAGALRVDDSAEILCVATDDNYRRCGIAKKTLTALIDCLSDNGVLTFNLEVRASNPAVMLYESLGFERVGRRKNYYTDPLEDAVLMTKGSSTF